MPRKPILAAAMALAIPATAHASPWRSPAPLTRSEAAAGHGVWIGVLVFLLAAGVLLASYGDSGSGHPASP